MSEANGKVCCNCGHNIMQETNDEVVECFCEIDGHYIGFVACMQHWCRHWAREKKWDEGGDTK